MYHVTPIENILYEGDSYHDGQNTEGFFADNNAHYTNHRRHQLSRDRNPPARPTHSNYRPSNIPVIYPGYNNYHDPYATSFYDHSQSSNSGVPIRYHGMNPRDLVQSSSSSYSSSCETIAQHLNSCHACRLLYLNPSAAPHNGVGNANSQMNFQQLMSFVFMMFVCMVVLMKI